jgi:histidyl-tRNA synthetase
LIEFVGKHAREHFDRFQELLCKMNLSFKLNDRLVRGLDYYTNTVFEWVTEELGSQGAVCAGGRYDGLVEQLGGKSTPAVGLAMGLDRIVLLHEKVQGDVGRPSLDIYICILDESKMDRALILRETLSDRLPTVTIRVHMGGGNLKKQLKRADASGAGWAILHGAEESGEKQLVLKDLRGEKGQVLVSIDELIGTICSA